MNRAGNRQSQETQATHTQTADQRRAVVRDLRAQKYSAPDVSRVLGVSKQRVYQLEKA